MIRHEAWEGGFGSDIKGTLINQVVPEIFPALLSIFGCLLF
jgi:hypothetical protein